MEQREAAGGTDWHGLGRGKEAYMTPAQIMSAFWPMSKALYFYGLIPPI